ncbi:MAG: adenylosuccinate synthetase, partial [Planctomycetes bacterium]|nr:adenylosuccinate synthetase [Planctomycetota bacterium]
MASTAIIGLQWGDEGKGKIIDGLAHEADVVARYAGGNNAGHTVIVGNEKYVLHLIPGGILHSGKVNLIGRGVVIDLEELAKEVDGLEQRGIPV